MQEKKIRVYIIIAIVFLGVACCLGYQTYKINQTQIVPIRAVTETASETKKGIVTYKKQIQWPNVIYGETYQITVRYLVKEKETGKEKGFLQLGCSELQQTAICTAKKTQFGLDIELTVNPSDVVTEDGTHFDQDKEELIPKIDVSKMEE